MARRNQLDCERSKFMDCVEPRDSIDTISFLKRVAPPCQRAAKNMFLRWRVRLLLQGHECDTAHPRLRQAYRKLIAPSTAAMKSRRSSTSLVNRSGTVTTALPLTVDTASPVRLRFKNR